MIMFLMYLLGFSTGLSLAMLGVVIASERKKKKKELNE